MVKSASRFYSAKSIKLVIVYHTVPENKILPYFEFRIISVVDTFYIYSIMFFFLFLILKKVDKKICLVAKGSRKKRSFLYV